MNAIAGLLLDVHHMERSGIRQIEPFISEGLKAAEILRALADAVLGTAGAVRKDGAPLYEYPFLPEDGGPEGRLTPGERSPPASFAGCVNLTLNSLQVNSLAGSLGEAFSGFAAQTTALAAVYSPLALPESTGGLLPIPGLPAGPPSREPARAYPAMIGGGAGTLSVPESLVRSVSILQKLESIRTEMIRNLFFQKPAREHLPGPERIIPPVTIPQFPRGNALLPGPGREEPSGTVNPAPGSRYPGPLGTLFSPLHGMLEKSDEIAGLPLPAMVPLGHPSLPAILPPVPEPAGASLPVTTRRSATAPDLPGSPSPGYSREVQKKPPGRAAISKRLPAGTGIIEIPSLVPKSGKDLRSDMAAANTSRLSDGLARLSDSGTTQTVLPSGPVGVPQAIHRFSRGAVPSSPESAIPAAFGTITRYLTWSADVCRNAFEPLHRGSSGSGGFVSLRLPFTGSGGGGNLAAMPILQGKNIPSAGHYPVMNLAVSMMSPEVMGKAAPFRLPAAPAPMAPGITLNGMPPGASPFTPLYSLEHALPLAAPATSSGTPPAAGAGSPPVNFQNTFNITVTTTGRGDERELRELGKKIGVILSDELKRYGGLR